MVPTSLISQPMPITINKSLHTDEKTESSYQLLTPFQANVSSFSQATSLKVNFIYREIRRFSFCYKRLVDVPTMGTYKIYFSQLYDLPCNVSNSKQHVLLLS